MLRVPALVLATTLGLAACSPLRSSSPAIPTTAASELRQPQDVLGGAPLMRLRLSLFDAPLPDPKAQVNIALVGIDARAGAKEYPFQWFDEPTSMNLIELQKHSADFDGGLPVGTYTGFRFFVDTSGCNVVLFGRVYPIVWAAPGQTNSAAFVAVDANVGFTLGAESGKHATKISLDFNVLNSIKLVNGIVYVKPSISGANQAARVEGRVVNRRGAPVVGAAVLALDGQGRTVNFSPTAKDGSYAINALPPGRYTIMVRNSYVTAAGTTVTASGNDKDRQPALRIVLGPDDDLQLPALTD